MSWSELIQQLWSNERNVTLAGDIDTRTPIGVRDVLTLLAVEWQSLRGESQSAIDRRTQLLVWGTAGLAAVAAAAAQLRDEPIGQCFLLLIVPPLFSTAMATLWLGESMRAGRAGAYLAEIEELVDALLNRHLAERKDAAAVQLRGFLAEYSWRKDQWKMLVGPSWELSLRTPRRRPSKLNLPKEPLAGREGRSGTMQMTFPYIAQALYCYLAGVIPLWFVAGMAGRHHWSWYATFLLPAVVWAGITIYFIGLWQYRKRIL